MYKPTLIFHFCHFYHLILCLPVVLVLYIKVLNVLFTMVLAKMYLVVTIEICLEFAKMGQSTNKNKLQLSLSTTLGTAIRGCGRQAGTRIGLQLESTVDLPFLQPALYYSVHTVCNMIYTAYHKHLVMARLGNKQFSLLTLKLRGGCFL